MLRLARAAGLVLVMAVSASCEKPAPLSAPAPAPVKATVTVAAASSVKPAMEDLVAAYKGAHPDVEVVVTYGASGSLTAQIVNGGPFDLFYSADLKYPRDLVAKGMTRGPERIYATGTLVLWVRRDSGLDIASRGAAVLADAGVKHIAIANPDTAPYGRAAKAALEKLGLSSAVEGRLVTGENVEQTAQFAQTGAAEAAFVPLSLALAPAMSDVGAYWTVPPSAYPAIEQGVVVMSRAGEAAVAFEAYVADRRGQEVLASHGFGPALE